jgi:hypothetical protein
MLCIHQVTNSPARQLNRPLLLSGFHRTDTPVMKLDRRDFLKAAGLVALRPA